jgi:hypothetical protein
MRFDQFMGGSYESQSTLADCSRTINWYPEQLQDPGASCKTVLYPTPGVVVLDSVGVGNGRAHYYLNGREFAVIGETLYEINSNGILTSRGSVGLDNNPATITSNGDGGGQLFITSNTNGFCYDLATNVLTQVATMNGKCTMGDMLDGRFLVLDAATSTFYISALFDGLTWAPGLDFAQRSLAPDPWRAIKVVGRLVWLFGEITSEAWYDTGANFPYAPAPSGLITYGIAAPFSATIIGNDVIWLGSTKSGRVCVVKATGYSPEVLSNYPLETVIESYPGVSLAVGDAYSDAGHTFFMLGFDQADATWVWDAETKLWHERGTWIAGESRFVVWRPRYYARAFEEHRMLDASGGSVYRMGLDLNLDVDGLNIRRVRRAPAIINENKRVYYSEFELDIEPGLADPVPTVAAFTMTGSTVLGSTVSGVVTYDAMGGPFVWPSAVVSMTVDGVPWPGGDATADVNGYYQFLAVPAGTIDVAVTGTPPTAGPSTGNNSGVAAPPAPLTLDIYAVSI